MNDTKAHSNVPASLHGVQLLLVDDSPDNQMLFKRILTSAGADVTIATNGAEAVDTFSKGEFDVIIMDIRMPFVDGCEASRRIRALGFAGPIMALTAHATPGEEERCRDAGCSDFQVKPIHRAKLISAVERLTSN